MKATTYEQPNYFLIFLNPFDMLASLLIVTGMFMLGKSLFKRSAK